MRIINTSVCAFQNKVLVIGFEGENERTQVRIDASEVFTEYPHATPSLTVKPYSGEAYPAMVNRDGTDVVWDITSSYLTERGECEIQLTFIKDSVVCKSYIGKALVLRSLTVEGEMPTPVESWVDAANAKLAEVDAQIVELEGMVDTATDAAERAAESAEIATEEAVHAEGSAETATAKANEATQAAGTATAKAAEAEQSAQTATQKATAAADSERIATEKAGEATTAAGTATTKATEATEAAQTATEKAGDASASATAAQTSATNAASSATAASASETAAKASETAASTSATQAAQSVLDAGANAQTATQKAAEATQSATNAATFAGTATTKAEEAAASAQAAQDAKTAVEQTAEQLADSLEQIEQNTQDIAELDERKANIDGYYPDMTVGNAEQLNSSKYVENSEPYTLRTSGGSSDIGNREYLDAVVGGTVAWNQAVRDSASENSTDFADVVTVTDAVEDAAGVKVKLEPVQDLHGYDHPWPAGGGKNLFNPTASAFVVSDLYHGQLIGAGNGESVALSLTDKGNNADISGVYLGLSGNGINSSDGIFWLISNGNVSTLSNVRTNMPYVTIYGNLENTLAKILARFNVQAELATTPTAWTPYSNICPISGWDGVKVTRTGKNLFDNVWEIGLISNTTGENQYGNAHVRCKNYIPCKNGQYIYMGWDITATGSVYMLVMVYGADGSFKRYAGARTAPFPLKLNDDEHFIRFYLYNRTEPLVNPYIVYGTTATDYEPYAGNTYSVTLPTEAGTVYGGTLDVSTGELVVDRASVVVNDTALKRNPANWYNTDVSNNRNSFGVYFYLDNTWLNTVFPLPDTSKRSMAISDSFVNAGGMGVYGNDLVGYFYIHQAAPIYIGFRISSNDLADTSSADAVSASAMTYLHDHPVQLCYYIAEPQTHTLTPTQIRTLLGTNNVWSDAGQTVLTYTGTDEHLTLESGKKYLSRISGTDSMLLGSGQEITAAKGTDNVFDLTQMFGTAVADYVYGQGAGFFRKWFGKQWYPYNAGELLSVEGLQSHDMVGFNQWDETVKHGYYTTLGDFVSNANYVASDLIPILPSATYCLTALYGYMGRICFYDSDKTFISTHLSYENSHVFTAPANARYLSFDMKSGYGATYRGDICLNLSHSGARNGEYEPYAKHSYPLDSSVILRGIPKVGANGVYWDGDRYLPDGTVERRYGVVDLGTLTWGDNGNKCWVTNTIPDIKPVTDSSYTSRQQGVICTKYSADTQFAISGTAMTDKTWLRTATVFAVKDTAYENVAAFKSAMSGVMLVYELSTPTTETAQPYHSTQWVSDWGTEEFVSTGIVPVGHETRYPANLRDKLQHLPDAASGNGSYLITQTDGQMVLTPFPAPPSTAGNYVLKATVTGGVATYTWEVAT